MRGDHCDDTGDSESSGDIEVIHASGSDGSSDIEVVEVRIPRPKTKSEFVFSELVDRRKGVITIDSLVAAMERYDIAATNVQVQDMLNLCDKGTLNQVQELMNACGINPK